MPKTKMLNDLFHDTLKDIYYAEKKVLSALPKMAKAAQNPDLKAAFEKHHGETEEQIERLEQVFAEIDEKPRGKTYECHQRHSRRRQGNHERIQELPCPRCRLDPRCPGSRTLRNLPLRNTCDLGRRTRQHRRCEALKETLAEEEDTDEALSELASSIVNQAAQQEAAE